MEQQPSSSGGTATSPSSSSQRRELQGPRPAPLKVRKDSHKIRKPPPAPQQQQPVQQVRPPVIIYTVSPKVVHAEPSEFMSVVQRLTGARRPPTGSAVASSASLPAPAPQHQTSSSSSLPFPFFGGHQQAPQPAPHPQLSHFPLQLLQQQEAAGAPPHVHDLGLQLSPAARLAAIERASTAARRSGDVGGPPPQFPSILSPGSLPAIPPNLFFSPPARGGGGMINLFSPAAFLTGAGTTGGTGSITVTAATAGASQNIVMVPEEASASAPSPSGAYYWDLFNNRHY